MSALVPIEQKQVIFYEDEITAVLVEIDGKRQVLIPIRPIVERLGLNWSGQFKRIQRDPVLSTEVIGVGVTPTPSADNPRANPQQMMCLPLEFLNGFLFGVSAERVRQELREQVIRYQRECYRVLAQAFARPTADTGNLALMQVREMGLAIVRMAEEQMEFERRLVTIEVKEVNLTQRVEALEQKVSSGETVTDDQASQISQAVKAVAIAMSKQSKRNEFGACYGEMYRKFGITSYKLLPARRFKEAMAWLTAWYTELTGSSEIPF